MLLMPLVFNAVTPGRANAATVTEISAGSYTTCVLMSDGSAHCWGDNTDGQRGNGTTTSDGLGNVVVGGHTWLSISTGGYETCGIDTSHDAYCWGDNSFGEIGDGTSTNPRTTPTLVAGGLQWQYIYTGYDGHVCGITTSNDAYCWGNNNNCELGSNCGANLDGPGLVDGGYKWSTISINGETTCGVTTTNVGYCWGDGRDGQVGDGTNGNNYGAPEAVVGGHAWSFITTGGGNQSCGITTANDAYCWGVGWTGNLGDGNWTEEDSPSPVAGGYKWSQITIDGSGGCGLTTGGNTYCWGGNWSGEVGDGTTNAAGTPVAVSGSPVFTTISAGSYASVCGLAPDDVVYCWGDNATYVLGDGTTNNHGTPTEAVMAYAIDHNSTLSVTVLPTFTFTVGNRSSACNGESNFVSGAGTASAVALGKLAAGANVSGGQALTVAGNSGGGFAVYVRGAQTSQNLRSGTYNWTDVSGTYASPTPLGGGEQFGYTYHDATTATAVTNPPPANFVKLDSATSNAVMGSVSSESGSGCVSYDAQASASTPAGTYVATVIYTAVPTY